MYRQPKVKYYKYIIQCPPSDISGMIQSDISQLSIENTSSENIAK